MKKKDYQVELLKHAVRLGAADAVVVTLDDIVFDKRTLLKCMFGCKDWGKGLTCPSRPGYPTMAEMRGIIEEYRWGIVLHTHDKPTGHKISYEIERKAFEDGYYFAFSLSDCACCPSCSEDGVCRNPTMARPAFHSVGIDVFKTVKNLGLPLKTLKSDGDEQNWYSAVFVE